METTLIPNFRKKLIDPDLGQLDEQLRKKQIDPDSGSRSSTWWTVLKKINPTNDISLKGRIIGYDDLLEELKLDQCIIQ